MTTQDLEDLEFRQTEVYPTNVKMFTRGTSKERLELLYFRDSIFHNNRIKLIKVYTSKGRVVKRIKFNGLCPDIDKFKLLLSLIK